MLLERFKCNIRVGEGYSDLEVILALVEGRTSKNNGVLFWWYSQCKTRFNTLAARFETIPEYYLEDTFQDSFIILWHKVERHQLYYEDGGLLLSTKNGTTSVQNLMAYFTGICKNKFLELTRSTTLVLPMDDFAFVDMRESDEYLYWDENPENEKFNLISKCISELPKSCMEILRQFYYENKSLDQILAERKENVSYDGLKTRKSKCLSNLKSKINKIIKV